MKRPILINSPYILPDLCLSHWGSSFRIFYHQLPLTRPAPPRARCLSRSVRRARNPPGGFAASSGAPAGAAPTARRAQPAPSPQKPPRFVPRESWRRPLRAHAPAPSVLAAPPRGYPSPPAAPAAGSVPGQLRSEARWDCPEPSPGWEAGRGGVLERRRVGKINRGNEKQGKKKGEEREEREKKEKREKGEREAEKEEREREKGESERKGKEGKKKRKKREG